jgi:hypothetical protein
LRLEVALEGAAYLTEEWGGSKGPDLDIDDDGVLITEIIFGR